MVEMLREVDACRPQDVHRVFMGCPGLQKCGLMGGRITLGFRQKLFL